MNRTGFLRSYLAVTRRELLSLVVLPQTYVIAAAYVVVSGVFFVSLLGVHELPDLERFYSNLASTLVVLTPIIAMRGFAEERATGSLDVMLSWPLSRFGAVLAKFTVNFLFAWALISVSWIYVKVMDRYASVEVGKQMAGYLGLLALAAAFSAISLAVSARSASVAGGAFVGVLVLLTAWSVQYAEEWPLGKTLAQLSPARRIEAAEQGVLYPSDFTYFLVIVIIGLGLTHLVLERQSGVPRAQHARRLGAFGGAFAAVAILAGVAGNAMSGQIDLTPTQRYTLTPASRQIATAIDQPISVSAFVDPASGEAVQIRNLYRRYRAAGIDMTLQIVDPDKQPGRMKALGITGYGQLQVKVGQRTELVDHFGEIALTSGIYRVGRADPRQVCFTTGHGERSIDRATPEGYSGVASALRRVGHNTSTVVLAAPGAAQELEACDVLVVAGGTGQFEPVELELIAGLSARGSRLVVLAEGGQADPSPLNSILAPYGLGIRPGTVHDTAALANDAASVVCLRYPSESPVTKRLSESGLPTLMVGAQEVTTVGEQSQDSVTPLLTTSGGAWVDDATDQPAARTLALAFDRSAIVGGAGGQEIERSRVGLVGTVEVGANRFLDRFGNEEFIVSLVQWTASEAELISAGRDPGGTRKLDLTDDDQDDIVRRAVIFPGLAALVPLPMAVRRLRRS